MSESNRQVFPPGLWVIATPIGNLSDLTPRARYALETVDLLLCEDTRRTAALLSALGIPNGMSKLRRFDEHVTPKQLNSYLEDLQTGKTLGLVTDAGTPAISDPGSQLVALAHQHHIHVTPFPGPSAVVTLLSVSGFMDCAFCFRGFFPKGSKAQEHELQIASQSVGSRVFLWFESPLRILDTLEKCAEQFSSVQAVVGKELTKLHEKFFTGLLSEVKDAVFQEIEQEGKVGEWCFALQFAPTQESEHADEGHSIPPWVLALECLADANVSSSQAAKSVSQVFDISKKEAYAKALLIFGKKKS